MFHRVSNAGKHCLHALLAKLSAAGLEWMDIQMVTPVLETLGGKYVERAAFLRRSGVRRCVLPLTEPRQFRIVAQVTDWNMRVFERLHAVVPVDHPSHANVGHVYGKALFDAGYAERLKNRRQLLRLRLLRRRWKSLPTVCQKSWPWWKAPRSLPCWTRW